MGSRCGGYSGRSRPREVVMPAIPSISVWPAIAIAVVIAVAIGVLFALLDARLSRVRESEEPVDEIVLTTEPTAAPAAGTVLDRLATDPEEPGDLRRSA